MIFQDKSSYIDELTDKEIYELQISELTGDINRASNYEAEIFYCGTMPFDNAYDVLSKNLRWLPTKSHLHLRRTSRWFQ